jgi:hypothetical protein
MVCYLFFPSFLLLDLREEEYVSWDRIITAPPPSREKKSSSGVNIPDPQHNNLQNLTANVEQASRQEKAKAIKYWWPLRIKEKMAKYKPST